ncbi:MAG: hypothetical protein ACRD39_06920, partial [Nitrososphaeraceae archaeon]
MNPTINNARHFLAPRNRALLYALLGFVTFSENVFAQAEEVSVLPQYFAANPLIRRDPLFEEIHTSLNTAIRNTGLGLNENISARLNDLERYVSGFSFKVSVAPSKTEILFNYEFFDRTGSVTINSDSLDAKVNRVADLFILRALEEMSVGPANGDRMDLNKLLLFILSAAVRQEPVDLAQYTTFSGDDFARRFRHDFIQYMKSVIDFPFEGERFEY